MVIEKTKVKKIAKKEERKHDKDPGVSYMQGTKKDLGTQKTWTAVLFLILLAGKPMAISISSPYPAVVK